MYSQKRSLEKLQHLFCLDKVSKVDTRKGFHRTCFLIENPNSVEYPNGFQITAARPLLWDRCVP